MQEIEVKARVKNKELVLQKLDELGCMLSSPITQKDRIYIQHGATFPIALGDNALRIREQNNTFIFTLKQPQKNELDCIEQEVTIDDPESMDEICKLLGYYEVSQVEKIRRKCRYQEYEICLDEVKNLGTFIEVEKQVEAGNGEAVQKELFAFLQTLGITASDQVFHGYDILLYQQQKKK